MLKYQRGAVRAVTDMRLFVLLLLSDILCSASGLQREYYYLNTQMSWSDAQSYCRENYKDLATVDSMDDVNKMMNTVNGYSGSVWIGLKRPTTRSWVWSMGNETLTQYSSWWGSKPSGAGDCVFSVYTVWYDHSCAVNLDFVCYDVETTGYILITDRKTWRDAQSHCRQYHTDLASIHSLEEQNQIRIVSGDTRWVWIGLFSDSWQWSDQWSLSFTNWAAGQPSASGDCVATSTTDPGKWIQNSCELQCPFICYEEAKFVKKQTVRFYFTHDGEYSLPNSSLQTAILYKISEKLKSIGMGDYKSISWRKNEGGEVFHLSKRSAFK